MCLALPAACAASVTFDRLMGNARKLGKDGFVAMYTAELCLGRKGHLLCCNCFDDALYASDRHAYSDYFLARVNPLDPCERCGSASEDTLVVIDMLESA
jgi:hypothetical protein